MEPARKRRGKAMKSERQTAIRNLLRERSIQTQEELAAALRSIGFQVTQATVSRDIKDIMGKFCNTVSVGHFQCLLI